MTCIAHLNLARPPPVGVTPFFGSKRPLWRHRRKKAQWAANAQSNEGQPDLVERMVGLFFGKKALEDQTPFGLKRMSADEVPELYPATTTEFAAPLEGDSPDVAFFRPLLAKTQLERRTLRSAPLIVDLCIIEVSKPGQGTDLGALRQRQPSSNLLKAPAGKQARSPASVPGLQAGIRCKQGGLEL
jgi:hypothetical protein